MLSRYSRGLREIYQAVRSAGLTIEMLEQRRLLSVDVAALAGPFTEPGTLWTYNVSTADGQSATLYQKAVGPTTFNGNDCTEIDLGSMLQARNYEGFDAEGDVVLFGGSTLINDVTNTDTYSPDLVEYPVSMDAGVPLTFSDTDTSESSDGTDSSSDSDTDTLTLVSESTTPVTVPAGTYDAYQITVSDTNTSPNGDGTNDVTTSSATFWLAPDVGLIKSSDSNGNAETLTAFNGTQDHLVFSTPPAKTAAKKPLDPAITVSAEDPSGAVDTNATGSITVSLNSFLRSGTGTLSGTLTEPLVDGVATFSDLSVTQNGNYQLSGTDSDDNLSALSGEFRIGNTGLQLEVTPHGANTAGVTTGDVIYYTLLVTPAHNETIDTQKIVATLPNGFIATDIDGEGMQTGNTITWDARTNRLVSFYITVPDDKTLAGLTQITVSAVDDVTYTDTSTDEATSTSAVNLRQRVSFDQNPVNTAVGAVIDPAVTVDLLDGDGSVDTASSDVVTVSVAKGPGRLMGTLSVAAVGGVATFSDLDLKNAGNYVLMARDSSNSKAFATAKSTAFVIVGLRSISAMLGTQKQTSTDDGLDITNANTFAVAQSSSGSLVLTAAGLSPDISDILQGVQWAVVRNSADELNGALPVITPSGSNPLDATISLDSAGSFNVICYYDGNGNGSYDEGEQLRVFHLAEVAVNLLPQSTVTPSSSNFGVEFKDGDTILKSGDFISKYAIQETDYLQVVGGGSNGMIGVSKIHLGLIQNGTADTVAVTYSNGTVLSEHLKTGTFPILDAAEGPSPVYPQQIFDTPTFDHPPTPGPGPTRDPVIGTDPAGGEDRLVGAVDSPNIVFPTQLGTAKAVSTMGSNDFTDYVAAYSDSFKKTYVGDVHTAWIAQFAFVLSSTGTWQNNASSVSDSTSALLTPSILNDSAVKLTGPIFVDEAVISG